MQVRIAKAERQFIHLYIILASTQVLYTKYINWSELPPS